MYVPVHERIRTVTGPWQVAQIDKILLQLPGTQWEARQAHRAQVACRCGLLCSRRHFVRDRHTPDRLQGAHCPGRVSIVSEQIMLKYLDFAPDSGPQLYVDPLRLTSLEYCSTAAPDSTGRPLNCRSADRSYRRHGAGKALLQMLPGSAPGSLINMENGDGCDLNAP